MKNRGAGAAEPEAGPSNFKRPATASAEVAEDANSVQQDASDGGPKQKRRKGEAKAKIEVTEDQGGYSVMSRDFKLLDILWRGIENTVGTSYWVKLRVNLRIGTLYVFCFLIHYSFGGKTSTSTP